MFRPSILNTSLYIIIIILQKTSDVEIKITKIYGMGNNLETALLTVHIKHYFLKSRITLFYVRSLFRIKKNTNSRVRVLRQKSFSLPTSLSHDHSRTRVSDWFNDVRYYICHSIRSYRRWPVEVDRQVTVVRVLARLWPRVEIF